MQEYQQAFSLAQDSETRAVALLGIGQTNYLMKNYSGAIEALSSIIEVYSEGYHIPKTYFYLAQSFSALEDYMQAAVYYAGFLEVYSGVLESFVNELLGDALLLTGNFDGAISAFQESIAKSVTGDAINAERKLGQAYLEMEDYENAVRIFMGLYERTDNDYIKAEMNWLAGQAYLAMEIPEQAYARFQDSIQNYPISYDSYLGLVALVNANQPVNDLDRGLVNYFVDQYGLALDAFNQYLKDYPEH
ncbi:MAG: tetratricopeptide repeat protein, partial [Anaerolineaceae bacterium]|nr:tetratricopeptide repeat protein [Anaerolineaceae bacterium]